MSQAKIGMKPLDLSILFVANLVPFIVGNILTNLLPVFARQQDLSSSTIGLFMSLSFLGVAIGTTAGGWLSDLIRARKSLLLTSGVLNVVVLGLMAVVQSFGLFAILTFVSMALIGFGQIVINTLAALMSDKSERGRVFGIIGLTFGLGLVFAGAIAGPIVDRWSFEALFLASALIFAIQPLIVLILDNVATTVSPKQETTSLQPTTGPGLTFYLLFFASLAAFLAQFIGVLGRPLVMEDLGFPVSSISLAVSASGVAVTPFIFLVGKFSDGVVRKPFISIAYISTFFGLILMVNANSEIVFIISATLLIGVNVGLTVGLALITDLFPSSSYGRLLSLYNSTVWFGAIGGFAVAGKMLELFGPNTTFVIASALPLLAAVLLIPVTEKPSQSVEPQAQALAAARPLRMETITETSDFITSWQNTLPNRLPPPNGEPHTHGRITGVVLEVMIMSGPDDGLVHRLSGQLEYDPEQDDVCCRFTIGRQSRCHVVIPFDPTASRVHATLHISDDGQIWLFDENSLNGSFVGRKRVTTLATPIEDHQLFRIGKTWMRIQCLDINTM